MGAPLRSWAGDEECEGFARHLAPRSQPLRRLGAPHEATPGARGLHAHRPIPYSGSGDMASTALVPWALLWLLAALGSAARTRTRRELSPGLYEHGVFDAGGSYCQRGDVCCRGRDDGCTVPYLDTICYCDLFCNRTVSDCCPDFWEYCLGIPAPFPKAAGEAEPPGAVRGCGMRCARSNGGRTGPGAAPVVSGARRPRLHPVGSGGGMGGKGGTGAAPSCSTRLSQNPRRAEPAPAISGSFIPSQPAVNPPRAHLSPSQAAFAPVALIPAGPRTGTTATCGECPRAAPAPQRGTLTPNPAVMGAGPRRMAGADASSFAVAYLGFLCPHPACPGLMG